MASLPLVGVQDDLAALVRLSLEHHHVPLTAIFEVFEELTTWRYFAVATPLLEEKGIRAAYFKIFTALEEETFATQTYLRLHTIVITDDELAEVRRTLRKGIPEGTLSKLAHLGEVVIRPIEDPTRLTKPGMIHTSRNSDGSFRVIFAPLEGASGSTKPKTVADMDHLKRTLHGLDALNQSTIDEVTKLGHASQFAQPTLKALYLQGLV